MFREETQTVQKDMKTPSKLSVLRKMRMKTPVRCHLTPAGMHRYLSKATEVGSDAEKLEPAHRAGANAREEMVRQHFIKLNRITIWPRNSAPRYMPRSN